MRDIDKSLDSIKHLIKEKRKLKRQKRRNGY